MLRCGITTPLFHYRSCFGTNRYKLKHYGSKKGSELGVMVLCRSSFCLENIFFREKILRRLMRVVELIFFLLLFFMKASQKDSTLSNLLNLISIHVLITLVVKIVILYDSDNHETCVV